VSSCLKLDWEPGGTVVMWNRFEKAIVLGGALIDTAESYGTEEIVGEAAKHLRSRVFIATKVSPKHFRRSDLMIAVDKSLQLLGTDYIDLY
jgi:diketogulonate reductase-like aldo/keto reductase